MVYAMALAHWCPMPESIVNLLAQVPLVAIFVWFILERDKRTDAIQIERDNQWREFLKEQREQNNAAVARLAEEIKSIAERVSEMQTIIRKSKRNV